VPEDPPDINKFKQSILDNTNVSGDLTTGPITQNFNNYPPRKPTLSAEVQREAVGQFLQLIESCFNAISLFHTHKPIILSEQYIPIQVTLERRYKHTVETAWSYAESEAELKRIYALKGGEEEIKRQQVSWKDAKREHSRIVVLADPGMGKSTLLRMEIGTTIQDSRQVLDHEQPLEEIVVPLFIRLSALAEKITETSTEEAILDILQNQYSKLLKHHENPEVSEFLREFLKKQLLNSKCLLLLDALDEVSPEKRHKLLEKLNDFARAYPTCQIVGTSRIVGYGGKLVDGAKEMEIVPFGQRQTEQYIETWFTNAQKRLTDQSVSAEGLIKALRERPQISGLAQNPLLLSLICSLYQQDKLTLPARRCQIYEKAVEFMLGEWRQTRQPTAIRVKEAKIRLLEALAYHFTCEEQEVFKYEDIFDWVEGYLENGKAPRDLKDAGTEEIIAELSENDGILQKLYLDRDDKQYLFLHRTFQEYFTASYLSRMIKKDSSAGIALVKQHLWKYDWHETLSLLAGVLEEPMPLIEAITAEKDDIFQTQLLLAGRCIAECKQTDTLIPLTSEIIEKILTFWRKYPDAEFIQSVVVAIVQNNLRIFQRLQESVCDLDKKVICRAIEALGKVSNAQAVDVLINVLNDSDKDVRWQAAGALGQIGSAQAVDALINVLNDSDKDVRWRTAGALGQIGNDQALDALIASLNRSDEGDRSRIIEALGHIGNAQALDALTTVLNSSDKNIRRRVVEVLGQIGNAQTVDVLIAALNDSDEYVRYTTAKTLGQIGNAQAVDALIATLNDSDKDVRWRAAGALGQIGNAQAVYALITALNDPDEYVRYMAAEALGQIGNAQAVDALIDALYHSDKNVRYMAAEALGQISNAQAVDALIATLNDSDEYVKYMAAEALGQLGNAQAVDVLIATLNDSDKDVRWRAVKALGQIGNAQAVDALIAVLNHSDEYVRRRAVEALGQLGDAQSVDALIAALNDSDEYVRQRAVKALGQISNAQSVDALIAALNHSDKSVKYMAAKALGQLGNVQAENVLIAALNDSDEGNRSSLIEALGRIGNAQAVDVLIAALNHSDFFVRQSAAEVLGQIVNSEVLAKLLQSLEINIYDCEVFRLIRTLVIRFSKDKKVGCIPVYPELVRKAEEGDRN
jgi:HEAT repeat protein